MRIDCVFKFYVGWSLSLVLLHTHQTTQRMASSDWFAQWIWQLFWNGHDLQVCTIPSSWHLLHSVRQFTANSHTHSMCGALLLHIFILFLLYYFLIDSVGLDCSVCSFNRLCSLVIWICFCFYFYFVIWRCDNNYM